MAVCRTCAPFGRPGFVPTGDGRDWQACPDCVGRTAKPRRGGGPLAGFVVGACVLGLVGYGAVRVFGVTAHPGKGPELDPLYGRGTSWVGTYTCGEQSRDITAVLLVAPKEKGDPEAPVDLAASFTSRPPGTGRAAKQAMAGSVNDTTITLTRSLTRKPAHADHFMSRFVGTVRLGEPIVIQGDATAKGCSRITMHSVPQQD